jgi:uncharacterized protein YjaG (DUF416 family)
MKLIKNEFDLHWNIIYRVLLEHKKKGLNSIIKI